MARFSFSIAGRKKQPVQPPAPLYPPNSKALKILGSAPPNHGAPAVWEDVSSPITTKADDSFAITTNPVPASYTELGLRVGDFDDQHAVIANDDGVWGEKSDIISNSVRLDAMILPNPMETAHTASSELSRKSRSSSSTLRSWYNKSKSPLSISHQTSSSAMAKPFTPPHTPLGLASLQENIEGTAVPNKKELPGPHVFQTMPQEHDHDTADSVHNDSSTTLEMDRMLTSPSTSSSSFTLFPPPPRERREPSKRMIKGNTQVPGSGAPHASSRTTLRPRSRNGDGSPGLLPSLYNDYEEMSMRQVIRRQSSTPNLHAIKDDGRLALPQNAARGLDEDGANGMSSRCSLSTSKSVEAPRSTLGLFPHRPRPSSSPGGRVIRSEPSRHTKSLKSTQRSLQGKDLLENSVLMLSSDSEEDDEDHNMESQGSHKLSHSRSQGNRISSSSSEMCMANLDSPRIRRLTDSGSVASGPTSTYGDKAPTASSSGSSVISDQSTSYSAMSWQDESEYDIQEAQAITMIPARRMSDLDMEAKMKSSSAPYRVPSMDQMTPPLSPTSVDFYIRSAHSSIDGLASPTRLLILTQQEEMLISAFRHKQQTRRQTSMCQISEANKQERVSATKDKEARANSTFLLSDRPLPLAGGSADPLTDGDTAAAEGHCSQVPQKSRGSQGSQEFQPSTPCTIFDLSFPTPPSFRRSPHLRPNLMTGAQKPAVPAIRTSGFGDGVVVVPSSPSGPPPTVSLPALPKVQQRQPTRCSSSRKTVSASDAPDVSFSDEDDEHGPNLDDIRHWEAATSPFYAPRHADEGNYSHEGDKPAPLFKANLSAFPRPSSCPRRPSGIGKQSSESSKATIGEDVPRPDSPISPEYFPVSRTHTRYVV
ncbi:hypothetical protein E4U55_006967 [Claviceps digitariae]|nr:hypothetical protein E4U55_006967 [Claviceps digitariae]